MKLMSCVFTLLITTTISLAQTAQYPTGPSLGALTGAPANLAPCVIIRNANSPKVTANQNGSWKIDFEGQYNYRTDCTFSKIVLKTRYKANGSVNPPPAAPGVLTQTFSQENTTFAPPDYQHIFAQVTPPPAGYDLYVEYEIEVTYSINGNPGIGSDKKEHKIVAPPIGDPEPY
jgi:hypothetical protein